MRKKYCIYFLLLEIFYSAYCQGIDSSAPSLHQIQTIQLPEVSGRLDHMAIDIQNKRLFVAAYGNNTLEVIDLVQGNSKKVEKIREPQDVLYLPDRNQLLVSSGENSSIYIFNEKISWTLTKQIKLNEDADNIRYDKATNRVFVGCGGTNSGALAVINLNNNELSYMDLHSGHPESFQLETKGNKIYVNIPSISSILVVNKDSGKIIDSWPIHSAKENYPMALDEKNNRLLIATRQPAKLIVIDTNTGKTITSSNTVGDADDIFLDGSSGIYVSGGAGEVFIYKQLDPDHYQLIDNFTTVLGARTSLLVPQLNSFYLAVPKHNKNIAEIKVYEINNKK